VTKNQLPQFSDSELNPKVLKLFEIIQQQGEMIQQLRDEVAELKKQKKKPKIKPSRLNKGKTKKSGDSKRPGSTKREKTKDLEIHETQVVEPPSVPKGSVFKGYRDFVVQDIDIKSRNTLFKIARWQTPDGNYIEGELPLAVQGHFGVQLKSYILYQYHQCHVTQPLLLEQLLEFGIEISSGQLHQILTENHEELHKEKDDILTAGLELSAFIQVDDTGSRHKGKNGYCTAIGNDLFAWFSSTDSKSRINFLELLQGSHKAYEINKEALEYMRSHKLPKSILKILRVRRFKDTNQFQSYLQMKEITNTRHVRVITEGALIGSLLTQGLNPDLVILSDDAGQFDVFLHALCWVHAERLVHKLVPFHDGQRADLDRVRSEIWDFYFKLKKYKLKPKKREKLKLEREFDQIFTQKTSFATLNKTLNGIYKNKGELLLVLDRPEIPLHNNSSESDIREYVKRRKVSGGTRSDTGQRSRDTFTSLKKTCRKLGVSFWDYLLDRVSRKNLIPSLGDCIRQTHQVESLLFASGY
jgi:hypothetical protein